MNMNKVKSFFAQENIDQIFKYVYLFHIVISATSILYGTFLNKITSASVLLLAAVVLGYRLLHIKKYSKYPFIILYLLFLVSMIISMAVNIRYGIGSNLKILIWTVIQFGCLYLFDPERPEEVYKQELVRTSWVISVLGFVFNIISIGMLFSFYTAFREVADGTSFLIGYASWGRLYGVFADPNYASVFSCIAVIAGIYLLMLTKEKKKRVFLWIANITSFLFIIFSASRTGLVVSCVGLGLYAFQYMLLKKKGLLKAIGAVFLVIAMIFGVQKASIAGVSLYSKVTAEMRVKNEDKSSEEVKIGRDSELSGDISNRRFDIWKDAVAVVKQEPVFGITFGNIVPYVKDKLPDAYIITNDFQVFNAFHNMFLDLLACQGLAGFVIFLSIIVCSLWYTLKCRSKQSEEDQKRCIFLFSACSAIVVSSLFVSEILYVHNLCTVVFWTLWGYLVYFSSIAETNNRK